MNIRFDPIPFWRKVKQPVFIAYGAKDETDNLPVYESVYRLQQTFHEIRKTNHQIHIYATGHALYEDDAAELRTELLNDLLTWLKQLK